MDFLRGEKRLRDVIYVLDDRADSPDGGTVQRKTAARALMDKVCWPLYSQPANLYDGELYH